MKKKFVKRIWIGFPVGIAMGYIITLVISACIGDGTVYSATPEFVQRMGTELSAVILQTALCGVLGSGFAAASVIWEIDSWSLAKQSGVYFIVIGAILLVAGLLSYVGIFIGIFMAVWLSQYLCWKARIKKMNYCIHHEKKSQE